MNDFIIEKKFELSLKALLEDFDKAESFLQDVPAKNVLVQKKLHIIDNYVEHDILIKLDYTRSIIEKIKFFFDFNYATYRLVMPNTVYNWHMDSGLICYHIPLISNNGCFFAYEEKNYKMLVGKLYKVQTGLFHTFFNAGPEARLHLTFENL